MNAQHWAWQKTGRHYATSTFVSLFSFSGRLNKARELLLNSNATPSEIYMDFGYDSLSNFSAAFKNEFGYSPKRTNSI